jgi:fructan beta-fructosidase
MKPIAILGAALIFHLGATLASAAEPSIVQTNRKTSTIIANAKRDFQIEKRFLNLPIKNGAPKRQVTTLVDGKVEVKNGIELAEGAPDWWAFMDVSAWCGKTVTLQVHALKSIWK